MEGPLGLKAQLRGILDYEGIHLNDLNPRMRFCDGTVKGQVEAAMYEAGITVQDLKKGSYYEYLELSGEDADAIMRNDYKKRKENKKMKTKEEVESDMYDIWKALRDLPKDADVDAIRKDIEQYNNNPIDISSIPKEEEDPHGYKKEVIEKKLRDTEKEGKFDSDGRPFPVDTSSLFPREEDDDHKYLEELMVRHNVHFPKDDPFRYKKIIDYHWKHIRGPNEGSFFSGVFDAGPLRTIPAAGPEFFKEEASYNKEEDDEKYLQELMDRHSISYIPKNDPWKHINAKNRK